MSKGHVTQSLLYFQKKAHVKIFSKKRTNWQKTLGGAHSPLPHPVLEGLLFKKIILSFSYILVISRRYVSLISSCPISEWSKSWKITYYTYLNFQFYFQITSRGQKHSSFMLNYSKISPIVLNWKSRLWVDFKIETVLQARRNKIKFKIKSHMADEEMGAATAESW